MCVASLHPHIVSPFDLAHVYCRNKHQLPSCRLSSRTISRNALFTSIIGMQSLSNYHAYTTLFERVAIPYRVIPRPVVPKVRSSDKPPSTGCIQTTSCHSNSLLCDTCLSLVRCPSFPCQSNAV